MEGHWPHLLKMSSPVKPMERASALQSLAAEISPGPIGFSRVVEEAKMALLLSFDMVSRLELTYVSTARMRQLEKVGSLLMRSTMGFSSWYLHPSIQLYCISPMIGRIALAYFKTQLGLICPRRPFWLSSMEILLSRFPSQAPWSVTSRQDVHPRKSTRSHGSGFSNLGIASFRT